MRDTRQTTAPRREPDWTTTRLDGLPVSVWTYRKSRRSSDRMVNGTVWYGTIVQVNGVTAQVTPATHRDSEAALDAVRDLFRQAAERAENRA